MCLLCSRISYGRPYGIVVSEETAGISELAHVFLRITDVRGGVLQSLVDEEEEAGQHGMDGIGMGKTWLPACISVGCVLGRKEG